MHTFMTAVIWLLFYFREPNGQLFPGHSPGVLSHPDYKVTFMLDHAAMVTVSMEKYGVFDCKPLAFLWAKFPEHYTEHNTIMFDDLGRNFVLNPQNGG